MLDMQVIEALYRSLEAVNFQFMQPPNKGSGKNDTPRGRHTPSPAETLRPADSSAEGNTPAVQAMLAPLLALLVGSTALMPVVQHRRPMKRQKPDAY